MMQAKRGAYLKVAAGAAAAGLAAALASGVWAQPVDPPPGQDETQPRAGLVVQYADGSVRQFCIELGSREITGLELLQRSGLGVRYESLAGGAQVCRIAGHGCADAEPCWCQCQVVGPDCVYWAYHTLQDGDWSYSRIGASSRTVRHGDVDGWAWGSGTASTGAQPPLRDFDDICAGEGSGQDQPTSQPTDQPAGVTPSPAGPSGTERTSTPGGGAGGPAGSETASASTSATDTSETPGPGSVPPPGSAATRDSNDARPSRTPRPTRTQRPTGTPRASSGASTPTSVGGAPGARGDFGDSSDAQPGRSGDSQSGPRRPVDAMLRATSDAQLATIAALAYAPGAADTGAYGADASTIGSDSTGADDGTDGGTDARSLAAAGSGAGDPAPADAESASAAESSGSFGGGGGPEGDRDSSVPVGEGLSRGTSVGYLVFGAVVVGLVVAWAWARARRRRVATR